MVDLRLLGAAVRRARKDRGLTLRGLAESAGLSERFLSDLEAGRGNIAITRLAAVARVLEVPLGELVACLDEATPERARPIALVGLRGAGKSTIGARLAEALGVRFVELDLEIEARAGLPLFQLFEIHGEAYYRELERQVLSEVLSKDGRAVIAAGGGLVTDHASWSLLRRRARTVWLRARPEEHYRRVMAQGDLRPMKNRPKAMAELRALLSSRERHYAEAELILDTSAFDVERAVEHLRSWVEASG